MTEGDSQMYGSHNIQFIHPYHWKRPHLTTDAWPDPATLSLTALPGAGNFLIFDNGCYNTSPNIGSRVLEINPRIGASGKEEVSKGQYIWPVTAGYQKATGNYQRRISNQRVWGYQSTGQQSFYSSHISGCQRLPNGNTSIMSGNQGHCFEVTSGGEVVWEYLYPVSVDRVTGQLIVKTVGSDSNNAWQVDTPTTKGGLSIFRHYRYGADFPAFAGESLLSRGTLTGRLPRLVGSTDTMAPGPTGWGYESGSGGGGGGAGSGGGGGGGY
jgi:hypothetical protein